LTPPKVGHDGWRVTIDCDERMSAVSQTREFLIGCADTARPLSRASVKKPEY
jgi:hypothetical protein